MFYVLIYGYLHQIFMFVCLTWSTCESRKAKAVHGWGDNRCILGRRHNMGDMTGKLNGKGSVHGGEDWVERGG